MNIWWGALALTTVVVAVLIWPLIRSGNAKADTDTTSGRHTAAGNLLISTGLVLTAPALAFALYLTLGLPGAPDVPLAGRGSAEDWMVAETGTAGSGDLFGNPAAASDEEASRRIADMVDGLAARLQDTPDDADGWAMLAQSYLVLDRPQDALQALERASTLRPEATELLIAQSRLLRSLSGQRDDAGVLVLLERVVALDPDHIEANWFLGLAAVDRGETAPGKAYLDRALRALPAGSSDRQTLEAVRARVLGESQSRE